MPCNSHRQARRGALRCFAATLVMLLLTGCGTLLRDPVPLEAQNDPSIPGFTDIRFYPLTEVEPVRKAIRQAFLTETPDNYEPLADGWRHFGAVFEGLVRLHRWLLSAGRPLPLVRAGAESVPPRRAC